MPSDPPAIGGMSAELKAAVAHLDQLLASVADTDGDLKAASTALAIRKERNRLLGLYPTKKAEAEHGASDDAASDELAAIASHLRPLKLTHESMPLREVARIAAERLWATIAAQTPPAHPQGMTL